MTRRSSSQSGEENPVTEKPTRKRIRDNHNELERVRRNNQKAQLEALRMALPFQDMDDKASMVSIFIRAREYIGMLEQRIMELQSGAGMPDDNNIQQQHHQQQVYHHVHEAELIPMMSSQGQVPILPSKIPSAQLYNPRERQHSVNSEHIQIHHGIPFYNPGFMSSVPQNTNMTGYVTPSSSTSPLSSRPASPISDQQQALNADILRSFVSDNFLRNGSIRRLSSDEESNLLKNFCSRRGSSLILPLEDETVMIQKRDSYSALFSGMLPDFVESSALNNSDEIHCNTCQKGMSNMIMIDCDRCHKWYHIKCARIDSDAIPTHWKCC